jgi:hypothetical protein
VSESTSHGRVRSLQAESSLTAPSIGMKIINLLHVVLAQAFYRWAMKEINPMHPDVPKIMLRQQQLAEKYRKIWA